MLFREVKQTQSPRSAWWLTTSWLVFGLGICFLIGALVLFMLVQGRVNRQASPPLIQPAQTQPYTSPSAAPSGAPSVAPSSTPLPPASNPAAQTGYASSQTARNSPTGSYRDVEDDTPAASSQSSSPIISLPRLPVPSVVPSVVPSPPVH